MKRVLLVLMCIVASVICTGQTRQGGTLPAAVITPPELQVTVHGSGSGYLTDYLAANIQYPYNSLMWDEEGVEVVQFMVTPAGEVADITFINSISEEIDREVARVLATTNGKWRPVTENGQPVAREKEVSIVFCTDGVNTSERFLRLAKNEFAAANKKFFVKKNFKSALYFYDKAVTYMPHDKSILLTRGMCKYQLGDKAGACRDWNRIRTLGGFEVDSYLNSFCELPGFEQMVGMVVNK
jgi:hypothetical protein